MEPELLLKAASAYCGWVPRPGGDQQAVGSDQGGVKISPSIWIYQNCSCSWTKAKSICFNFDSNSTFYINFTNTYQLWYDLHTNYGPAGSPFCNFNVGFAMATKKIKEHMHSLTALFEMMWKFNQGSHDFKSSCNTHVSLLYPRSDKSVCTLKSCYFWGRCSKNIPEHARKLRNITLW